MQRRANLIVVVVVVVNFSTFTLQRNVVKPKYPPNITLMFFWIFRV